MAQLLGGVNAVFVAYVLAFAAAAVACFASVGRARIIEDADTRRGLVALLVASGGWAAAHVGFLVAPVGLKYAFYELGLVVGLSAIGPWLYFCSAYTGRNIHRNVRIRRVAVGLFLAVVAVKLTNPLHGLYFAAALEQTPFVHLRIQFGTLHWVVTGVVYALSAVGYFMLFELFLSVEYDTRPLTALVGLTALPVALDIVGYASPALVNITYEPLGVAAFAVALLFAFATRFQAVQFAGGADNPAIYLDEQRRVRDFNPAAGELFPALEAAVGDPVEDALPALADSVGNEAVFEHDRGDETRYYVVSTNRFGAGGSPVGEMLVVSDVTDTERHRRELGRQNERLERFTSVVSHDLRNPLNVAKGRVAMAREDADGAEESLAAAADALDRMEELIEDILALARQGESIGETEPVALSTLVEECRESVDVGAATLRLDGDCRFRADPDRVRQLMENLLRNAIEHGGEDVTVEVGALDGGFYVADDGPGIPEAARERAFESGYTTTDGGTGFGLAIVAEIAAAHGWAVGVTESASGGARFEITGVTTADGYN